MRFFRPSSATEIRVTYAHPQYPRKVPQFGSLLQGGAVKYVYLNQFMPEAGNECHILYAVSSSHCRNLLVLMDKVQSQGIKVVWNQDGAYFPSAYGSDVAKRGNTLMSQLLHKADYIFYQSRFAKMGSDFFLGPRSKSFEILYNAVDTDLFSCPVRSPQSELVLLTAGSHNDAYRLPLALETLSHVLKRKIHARLLIAGRLAEAAKQEIMSMAAAMKLSEFIEITGPYSQAEAPRIFSRAHILLHTQYNDVCPTVVVEAMACGLPVIYSKTGGTPELVGEEAGYGIPGELDWDTPRPPSAEDMAEGVCVVAESLEYFSSVARARAVKHFDLKYWLERHRQVFEMLARTA